MAAIKISRGNNLLYETWANGEGNITSLASAIRTVQKESNEFLSKLVEEEKSSNNNTEKKSGDGNADDEEDEDDDSEEDADKVEKNKDIKVESEKRRNTSKSSLKAKKSRTDK